MKHLEIFLPGRIPSKKNSTVQIVRHGKPFKFPSKNYQAREKEMLAFLGMQQIPKIQANRVQIGYTFIRPDRRKADITNKQESINDMLVKYGFMEDDSRDILTTKYALNNKDPVIDSVNAGVLLDIDYDRIEGYVHPGKKEKPISGTLFDDFIAGK